MVKNVSVVWCEVGRRIQGFGCILRFFLNQAHDAEPHPSCRVFRVRSSLFLNRGNSGIQLVEMKVGDAKKEVGATQLGLQTEGSLKAGDRVFVATLLFAHQAEVEMCFRERRRYLCDGGESFP